MDSGLNDFIQQVPAGLIITFCGSGILLVVMIAVMVSSRARRAEKRANAAASGSYTVGHASEAAPQNLAAAAMRLFSGKPKDSSMSDGASSEFSGAELPDLDVLLSAENVLNDLQTKRGTRSGTFSVTLTDGSQVEVAEVMSILRDVAEGGLLVQIGEKVYRHPPALADAEFKRRFTTTVSELAKSVTSAAVAGSPSAAPVETKPADQDAPIVTPPPTGSSTSSEAFSVNADADPTPVVRMSPPTAKPNVPPVSTPQMPFDLPKYKLEDAPSLKPQGALRRPPKPTNQPLPEINVGGSVEAYLQHKLALTPEYANRSIHIRSAPKGGVVIEVDNRFFETVGDVDDAEVRAFLQATIEEWQARQ